jgi:hypothetical protein
MIMEDTDTLLLILLLVSVVAVYVELKTYLDQKL